MTFAACSRVLEGMQPTFRHTPPRLDQRSMSRHLQAQIRGAEGGGVATGARTQHHDLGAAIGFDFIALETDSGPDRHAHRVARASGRGGARGSSGVRCGRCRGGGCRAAAASACGDRAMTVPLATLSPRFTSTSVMVPAAADGTSMVALSVSRVISGVSTSTLSPTLTSTSTIGTASKLPISGTTRSMRLIRHRLDQAARLGEHLRQIGRESRRQRAIDDAMIVGQRQRQHQARHESAVLEYRLHRRARHAEDRHFRSIDDGRERRAADAAEAGNRESSRPASARHSACPCAPSPTARRAARAIS